MTWWPSIAPPYSFVRVDTLCIFIDFIGSLKKNYPIKLCSTEKGKNPDIYSMSSREMPLFSVVNAV